MVNVMKNLDEVLLLCGIGTDACKRCPVPQEMKDDGRCTYFVIEQAATTIKQQEKKIEELTAVLENKSKDLYNKLREKLQPRINALKDREEECLEVGDGETAARCNVAHREVERCLELVQKEL